MIENPKILQGRGARYEVCLVKAFIRATWLLDSWNLLSKAMDVRLEFADFPFLTGKALSDRMHGEEVFITNEDKVNAEALDGNRNLELIGTPSAGIDHINVQAATERGIPVIYSPGGNADSVAEYTFALILAISKRILGADDVLRKGLTPKVESYKPLMGIQLRGKTIGILGVGSIGSRVATIARAFGMDVLLFDPGILPTRLEQFGRVVELEELLKASDFVTVHAPLTNQTRGMLGPEHFRVMKNTAFFVNTARGKIVSEPALMDALKEHTIAGAALDVQASEPLSRESPLLTLDNVIVSPHIASYTREAQTYCDHIVQEEVIRYAKGEPMRYLANPEVMKK
jgi:phosphoglycerate dehydrogenase-like enzyme